MSNGDGQADVVAANAGSGNLSVLLGQGDGTLQAAANFGAGTGPVSLALADFNGDGRTDVVATGGGSTAVVLLGAQAATRRGAQCFASAIRLTRRKLQTFL